jgi:hypothetical protein
MWGQSNKINFNVKVFLPLKYILAFKVNENSFKKCAIPPISTFRYPFMYMFIFSFFPCLSFVFLYLCISIFLFLSHQKIAKLLPLMPDNSPIIPCSSNTPKSTISLFLGRKISIAQWSLCNVIHPKPMLAFRLNFPPIYVCAWVYDFFVG